MMSSATVNPITQSCQDLINIFTEEMRANLESSSTKHKKILAMHTINSSRPPPLCPTWERPLQTQRITRIKYPPSATESLYPSYYADTNCAPPCHLCPGFAIIRISNPLEMLQCDSSCNLSGLVCILELGSFRSRIAVLLWCYTRSWVIYLCGGNPNNTGVQFLKLLY